MEYAFLVKQVRYMNDLTSSHIVYYANYIFSSEHAT